MLDLASSSSSTASPIVSTKGLCSCETDNDINTDTQPSCGVFKGLQGPRHYGLLIHHSAAAAAVFAACRLNRRASQRSFTRRQLESHKTLAQCLHASAAHARTLHMHCACHVGCICCSSSVSNSCVLQLEHQHIATTCVVCYERDHQSMHVSVCMCCQHNNLVHDSVIHASATRPCACIISTVISTLCQL